MVVYRGDLHTMLNSKKIFLNTFFLYLRIGILMCVTLYTSRVLLHELGIEKFGVYGVIGGIVAIFSSLKTIFASSIQRFLNYAKGENNVDKQKEAFWGGIIIHIGIALLFFVLVELIGLWLIKHKLSISHEYLDASYWVFQCSVINSIILLMTIPFEALIIANERMSFFAYISIADGILKLLVIFLLQFFPLNNLEVYASLILLITLFISVVNIFYCKANFPECTKTKISKETLKGMSTFATWNFAGNFSYSMVNEGINILLNIFGGVIANAARTIAYQIKHAFSLLLNNIMIAITPQATHIYAAGEYELFFSLMYKYSKFIVYIYILFAIPIFMNLEDIIDLWLGEKPQYAISFGRLILVSLFFRAFHGPIDLLFKCSGKLAKYQIAEMIILILPLLFGYVFLKLGHHISIVFVLMVLSELFNLAVILYIAYKDLHLSISKYLKEVCFRISIVLVVIFIIIYTIERIRFEFVLLNILVQLIFITATIFFVGLNMSDRKSLLDLVKKVKKR